MGGALPGGCLTTALTRGASLAYEDDRETLDFLGREDVELRDRDLRRFFDLLGVLDLLRDLD